MKAGCTLGSDTKMLKKEPPPWGDEQTKAIRELKRIAQNPPALKIPGSGTRILQTDASDHFWGAVLLEDDGTRQQYCGHASGQFKDSEKHYHTTYKEALAVKNGIKKFDFHLRGHHFEVHMDNSSFPKILEFKNKMPPDPQILRLKDWFSRYDFSFKHIKGKTNLIPDFLSRPNNPIQMISTTKEFNMIFMMDPLPNMAKTRKEYPPDFNPTTITEIHQYARSRYFYFLHETMKFKPVKPFMFDPNTQGICEIFCRVGFDLCEPSLWAIWCKTVQHPVPIAIKTLDAYRILTDPHKQDYLFWTLLEWFSPIPWWRSELLKIINYQHRQRRSNVSNLTSIVVIHRPYYQRASGQIWTKNKAEFWGTFEEYPLTANYAAQLIRYLTEIPSDKVPQDDPLIPSRLIPSSSQGASTSNIEYFVPEGQFQRIEDLGGPEEDDYLNSLLQTPMDDSDESDPNLSPSHEPVHKG